MPYWSSSNDPGLQEMKQETTQSIKDDRLGLTDLLEISDLLLRNQTFRFRVASWSMSPALQKGDQITVEPAIPTSLQVGDVILFHQCGQLICHRVVALDTAGPGTRIITKGDAASACGEVIQAEQVLGRVVGVKPNWHWAGSLSKGIDCWLARLRDEVAQGLLALQGLRSYRWMMRALFSRCVAYHVGIPEGGRWLRYHRIYDGDDATLHTDRLDFRLLAKVGGTSVGSLECKADAEGCWIENLHVRIRYRGVGVGSHLLALATTGAARSGARWLLASVEPENRPAVDLFTKMGFRKMVAQGRNGVSSRQDRTDPTFTVLERAL